MYKSIASGEIRTRCLVTGISLFCTLSEHTKAATVGYFLAGPGPSLPQRTSARTNSNMGLIHSLAVIMRPTQTIPFPLNSDGKILELIESDDNNNSLGALLAGSGDFNSTVSTIAAINTLYDSYFAGGYIGPVEGRHFTAEDENPAIVSAELAELNGLRVGDKITLRMSEYKASMMGIDAGKTKIEVAIVGLFCATAKSTTTLSNWSMDNSIFTTLEVVKTARPDMGDEGFERIQFYVNDPGEMDNIVRDVKNLPDLDPTDFIVSVDSSDVDAVMEPLSNIYNHLVRINL